MLQKFTQMLLLSFLLLLNNNVNANDNLVKSNSTTSNNISVELNAKKSFFDFQGLCCGNPTITAPSNVFCVGSSITLTSSYANGNQWYKDGALIFGATSQTFIATSPGSYTVILYDNGSYYPSAPFPITAQPSPTVSPILGVSSLCTNENSNFSNSTIGGVWSSSNTGIASVNSSGVIFGVFPGNATIYYTVSSSNGCTSTVSQPVTVFQSPTVSPIVGSYTLCIGNTYSYSSSPNGGVWCMSDPTVASVNTNGVVTALTVGTTTISYKVTNPNGCSTEVTQILNIYANPVVYPIVGASSICVNNNTLFSSTTSGGTWSSSNPAIASVNSTGLVTGVSPGTTSIKYSVTNSNGCVTTISKNITVYANPSVNPISGLNEVCEGSTINLFNSTPGGVWSSSDPYNASVNSSGVVTGLIFGNPSIYYTVTNSNGCVTRVTHNVIVRQRPIVANITGNFTICANLSTQLSNTTAGGVWSSNNPAIASVNISGLVTGNSGGQTTINYAVSNGYGCTTTASELITIYANPIVALISGPSSLCVGQNATYSQATPNGNWNSNNPGVATIDNNGNVSAISPGTTTISYTVTNSNNCVTTKTLILTVYANPVVSNISGPINVCIGDQITLTNATPNGVWCSLDPSIATINTSGVLTGVSVGTVTVTYKVTNANGCSSFVSHIINVYAKPVVSPLIGVSGLCVGQNTVFSSITPGGTWSVNNPGIASISINGVLSASGPGTIIVNYTITNLNNCSKTVSKIVQIYDNPIVSNIQGSNKVCVGNTTLLSNSTSGGTWSSSNSGVATINSSGLVHGVSAGNATISYTVTNSNNCSTIVQFVITVNDNPSITQINGVAGLCEGNNITLTNATPNGTWSSTNTGVATINNSGIVSAISQGTTTIKYTVFDISTGCSSEATKQITVNPNPIVAPINGPIKMCVNETVTLNNPTSNGVWGSSNSSIATIDNNGNVLAIAPGNVTFSYFVTNQYGCSTVSSLVITVYANPTVAPITGQSSVCIGQTITMGCITPGGVWCTSDPGIATISTNGVVTGVSSGNVIISYKVTNANGCTTTVSKTITVNPNPILPAISGPNSVCVGNSINLNSGSLNGIWTSSNNFFATVSNGVVTGFNAGVVTITFTYTNQFGCTSSTSKTINVYANPIVSTISGPDEVCEGKNITLSCVSSNGVWSSSNTAVATVNSSGIVTGVTQGTATISYTVTNSNNCKTIVTKVITVNPNPIVDPITCFPSPKVCVGSTLQLNNTTANGVWGSSNNNLATVDVNGLVTGVAAGNVIISYTVTNSFGCSTTVTHNLTVNAKPFVSPLVGTSTICVGQNTAISTTTLGGVWSSSNSSIASVSTNGSVTAVAAGTTTINYTVTNTTTGCSNTATINITVYDNPIVDPINGPNSVCVGENITFTNTTTGGIWCTSNSNIASISTNGVVTGILAGTVTISYKITNANGCTTSSSQTVTVYAKPVVPQISGPSSVCVGNTITLNSGSGNGVWGSSDNSIASVNNGIVTGHIAGTTIISYTVTNLNGCSTTVTKTITVNPKPNVAPISGPNSVCVGKTVQLNCPSGSGNWSSSNTSIATINNAGIINGISAGIVTISYTVTNSFGCSTIVTYDVTVYANPVVAPITCFPSPSVCIGNTLQLYNSTSGGTWSSSVSHIASVDNNGLVTGNAQGTVVISYTVTNSNGCSTTVTYTVTVNPKPPTSPIYGPTSVCVGNTILLNCGSLYGQWSSSNPAIASISSNGIVTGVSGGTVTINYTITNSFGCSSTVSYTITVASIPSSIVISASGPTNFCYGGSVTLYSNCSVGNQWYKNGVAIPGATGTSYVATQTGNYNVIVNNGSGCTATSNSIYVYAKIVGSSNLCIKFCGTCNYVFRGQVYTSAGVYYIHVPCAIGCDSIITLTLIDTCGWVSGGGGGGVESKTLGDVISKRLYGNAVNSVPEVNGYGSSTKFTQSGAIVNGPNDLTLSNLVPATVNNTNAAYVSTPIDILNFTNAVEILSVDYTENNITKAVAFGTKTLGDVYNHTKPICDRLKGAELLEVKNITVNGFSLMAYKIKQRTGEIEFAVNLSAGTAAARNTISLQSNWFTDNYQADEKLYNFQLWAVSYEMVETMAQDIITKLQNNAGVNSVTSADLPKAYISKGNRKATDLTVTIQNNTAYTSGYFEILEKANEQSSTTTRKLPFTVNANGTSTLTLPVKDYYEGSIYVYLNNNLTDLVYLADGTWSLDYDKTKSTISKFNVNNEGNYTSKSNEYRLLRNVEMTGTTKDYITIYKTMMGGGLEENILEFKNIIFNAKVSGAGRINVTFVKKGISNWDDQYNYTLPVDGADKEYIINFNQLKSKKITDLIKADDITAISFSFINGSGVSTPITANLSKVRFTKADISNEIIVQAVNVFPNPSIGKFLAKFTSQTSNTLMLKVYESTTGKLIKTQYVNATIGDNQVAVNLTEDNYLTSGVYIITLEGDEVKFAPTKLILNKN